MTCMQISWWVLYDQRGATNYHSPWNFYPAFSNFFCKRICFSSLFFPKHTYTWLLFFFFYLITWVLNRLYHDHFERIGPFIRIQNESINRNMQDRVQWLTSITWSSTVRSCNCCRIAWSAFDRLYYYCQVLLHYMKTSIKRWSQSTSAASILISST